jgi:hypothetical protein
MVERLYWGAFFIGTSAFYNALNEMSEEERSQFAMSE